MSRPPGAGVRFPGHEYVRDLLRRERRLLLRFVLSSVGRSALTTAAILLIREFFAGIIGERTGFSVLVRDSFGPGMALAILAALLVGAYIGSSALTYDNEVTQQRLIKILELGTMERIIRHLLGLSVSVFDRQSHGDIIHAVRQDVSELRIVVVSLAKIFLEGVMALGLLASAVWLSPRLAFWALFLLPVTVFPIILIARRTLARSYAVRKSGYLLYDMMLQMLRGIRVIKAYRGEEEEARSAVEKGRRYFDEVIELVRIQSLSRVVLESLAGLGIVVVVVIGGLEVLRGQLGWPSLLAFLMAVRGLLGPLNNINTAYMEIKRRGASVDRIADLLAVRTEVPELPNAARLRAAPSVMSFDDVSFGYSGRPVLEHLSFDVRAAETIGIVGPSGAGKTSLLNLFARFYDPTSGVIRYDGRDLREYRLSDVYGTLAIVTQEPFLFSSSVRDNIRCGRPAASDAEVAAAAMAAEIHEDILTLPDGYDTHIGVGGEGLSVGQAQRINIARALLKNAPILLLDEATSSLDSLAEAKVQTAIDRLMVGRTTLVVAHRLSTLRGADRILVLDKGRCLALGTHEEVLRSCELYRLLWERQVGAVLT